MPKKIDTNEDLEDFKKYRLTTVKQVRKFMARIINQAYAGKYPQGKTIPSASQLVNMCNMLRQCIVEQDIERLAKEVEKLKELTGCDFDVSTEED